MRTPTMSFYTIHYHNIMKNWTKNFGLASVSKNNNLINSYTCFDGIITIGKVFVTRVEISPIKVH